MALNESSGHFGAIPTITGTRIGVHHIVYAWKDRDFTIQEIADRVYPQLSEKEVREALKYALDEKAEYTQAIEDRDSEISRLEDKFTQPEDIIDKE